MFNSTRGNSFRITKKVLCVVMAVSLSLMMLPAALFRTQAEAAPKDNQIQLVQASQDMTNFGKFTYSSNANAVNSKIYTQNDLLSLINCKAETPESVIESAEAQLKATLTENLHSVVEETLPAAKEGAKAELTMIDNVTSGLNCLTISPLADKATWQFVVADPGTAQSGQIHVIAKNATYLAEYELYLYGQALAKETELKVDTNIAAGKLILTPKNAYDANGNMLYKVAVDLELKNITNLDTPFNVSVTSVGNQTPDNPQQNAEIESNGIISKVVADAQVNNTATFSEKDIISAEYRNLGYKLAVSCASNSVNAKVVDQDGVQKIVVDYLHYTSAPISIAVSATAEGEAALSGTIIITNVAPVYIDVNPAELIATDTLDMRTEVDQKAFIKTVFDQATVPEHSEMSIRVNTTKAMWDSYVDMWGAADNSGKQALALNNNLNAFELVQNNTVIRDYALRFVNPVFVVDPVVLDPGYGLENSNVIFTDGNGVQKDPATQAFSVNEAGKQITVRVLGATICDRNDASMTFASSYNPVSLNNILAGKVAVNAFVKASDGTISILNTSILYANEEVYQGYEVSSTGTKGQDYVIFPSDSIFAFVNGITSFIFSNADNAVTLTLKFVSQEEVSTVELKHGNSSVDTQPASGTAPNYTVDFVFDSETQIDLKELDKDGNYSWKFVPTVGGTELEDIAVYKEGGTSPINIVSKAAPPAAVSIGWEPVPESDGSSTFSTTTMTIKVTDPYFEYTKVYKSNENVIKVAYKGHTYYEKYGSFDKDANGDWVLTTIFGTDSEKYSMEVDYTVSLVDTQHCITDLLGRPVEGYTPDSTTWSFAISKGPQVSKIWEDPTPPQEGYTKCAVLHLTVQSAWSILNDNTYVNIKKPDGNVETIKLNTRDYWIIEGEDEDKYELKNNIIFGGDGATYIEDGAYEVDVKITDSKGKSYSPQSPFKFTLDCTYPDVAISWDNTNAVNEYYYSSGRTVAIAVTEKNFNKKGDISFNNININGTPNSFVWSSSGDRHTTSWSFNSEGVYNVTITITDDAGNSLTWSYFFILDWTKPNIQISGVENRQAYGDAAAPTVTINDENMSPSTKCTVDSLGVTKGNPYSASPSTSDKQYVFAYGSPESTPDNDGVYRINVNAVDMAGNAEVQSIVWSVNRFGSTYVIDAETETMMDGYVNNDNLKDVIVTEINPSGVQTSHVDMTKGSFTETLTAGQDYTANASGGDESWYQCIYTINKDFFKEDGKYTLNYYSTDKVGHENENTMENKNAAHNAAVNVQFVLDNAKPTVSFDNLSEPQYAEGSHKASAKFEDNSRKFSEAKVIINGEENYVSGDDLEKDNYAINFELTDSPTPYTIEAVSIDKAGNQMDNEVKTVVITTNPFLLWFYNTPLFVGSLIVIAAAIGGVLYYLYRRGLWIFAK